MNIEYVVRVFSGIFTIDKGKIKILLMKKRREPYKGYWVLPESILNDESFDENINKLINDLGLPQMYLQQTHTYDLNFNDEKSIGISYIGLIDNITYLLKNVKKEGIEVEWFDINSIPKTAYNHSIIINDLYNYFRSKIVNSNILRILFPSDFTLPEVQKIYEQVLEKKLDRRNFRKKLLNLGYIIDTGDINEGYTGRPAKLYRFNSSIDERNLF